jgi:uncharacterized phage-associated protein
MKAFIHKLIDSVYSRDTYYEIPVDEVEASKDNYDVGNYNDNGIYIGNATKARTDTVARLIFKLCKCKISNLRLQRLLFICQVIHMGRYNGRPLFNTIFVATTMGPVDINLYRRLSIYGSGSIKDVFLNALSFDKNDYRYKLVSDVCKHFSEYSDSRLLSITHQQECAWDRVYEIGMDKVIPDTYLFEEYKYKMRKTNAASVSGN